jgi:SCP-2 sterol transfer family
VADFLTAEWFDEANTRLDAATGSVEIESPGRPVRVVLEVDNGPGPLPHAFTFTAEGGSATVRPGDNLAADLIVRLSFDDAAAISVGVLDSTTALREGRLKVRGDVTALIPLGAWMAAAQRVTLQ